MPGRRLAGTTGLVISGALTDLASWRWIFLVNLPVAAVALALIPRWVAESRSSRPPRPDVAGAVLGTGALVLLDYGLLKAAEDGWTAPASGGPLLVAAVLAASFVTVERRTAQPLVPRSLLSSRVRVVAGGTGLLFTAAFFSLSFLLMLHMQTVLGYQPLTAGLAYLPYAAGILAGVAVSTRAVHRLGVRRTLVTSFLISAGGFLLLATPTPQDGYWADVLPGMLIAGVGSGLGFPTLAIAALAGTTEDDAGIGSAVLNAVQQVGGAVGIAVLVGLAAYRSQALAASTPPLDAFTEGLSLALSVAAALLVCAAVLVAVLIGKDVQPPAVSRR